MKSPFPKTTYNKNATIYKILSNSKRLEILNLLCRKELCVDEMVKIIGSSKANLSQHLSLLRHAGLVVNRKDGLNVYYQIIDPRIVKPCEILHNLRAKKLVS